VILYGGKHFI